MSSNTLRKRAFGRRSLSQRYGRRRAFLASPVDSYSLLNESRVVASKPDGVDAFEEYKLFVEDTARFTDRRQTVTNICVTINSVLLSAVALLVKDADCSGG
jgi:hypothetical protein